MTNPIFRTPAEVKALWVKALRSGEYKQTRQKLLRVSDADTKSYCCLGVLCDLSIKDNGGGEWIARNSTFGSGVTKAFRLGLYQSPNNAPPRITSYIFGPEHKNISSSIITMNDIYGATFKEIAAYIERIETP
jgi:hypothetical protein